MVALPDWRKKIVLAHRLMYILNTNILHMDTRDNWLFLQGKEESPHWTRAVTHQEIKTSQRQLLGQQYQAVQKFRPQYREQRRLYG